MKANQDAFVAVTGQVNESLASEWVEVRFKEAKSVKKQEKKLKKKVQKASRKTKDKEKAVQQAKSVKRQEKKLKKVAEDTFLRCSIRRSLSSSAAKRPRCRIRSVSALRRRSSRQPPRKVE